MSTIKPTATQIKLIEEVLDGDHDTVSKAARAVWDAVADLVLERAKFAVVAQLRGTRERPTIPPSDPESIKLVLSYHGTAGEAQKAAESLVIQPQTGDKWAAWVLPVQGASAADFTKQRREQLTAAENKRKTKTDEAFRASIEKHRLAMLARAEEYREEQAA